MKLSQTMSAYKRRKREVKRTSQKLLYVKKKKTKFKKDNIVKLKGGQDMGYVLYYKYNKVMVKWFSNGETHIDSHLEEELVKVV
jgi:hypothetical protein